MVSINTFAVTSKNPQRAPTAAASISRHYQHFLKSLLLGQKTEALLKLEQWREIEEIVSELIWSILKLHGVSPSMPSHSQGLERSQAGAGLGASPSCCQHRARAGGSSTPGWAAGGKPQFQSRAENSQHWTPWETGTLQPQAHETNWPLHRRCTGSSSDMQREEICSMTQNPHPEF